MYKKGDFHIHSSESDGELKPGEIVLLAKDRRIDIISITDHNTISGVKQAVKTGNIHGVKVIPGIELSTRYKGCRVHILGYFCYNIYDNEVFISSLNSIKKGRFKKCQADFEGKVSFRSEGGKLTTKAGIEFLHYFNGFVVLAHPTLLKKDIFQELFKLKFDGIEAKYYRNKEDETDYFIRMAEEKGIIYTAGSDFHSLKKIDLKHGTLGQIYLENDEIEIFLKALNKGDNKE